MLLVDTSVWVSHLRGKSRFLERLLEVEAIYCHPFVIGELACGNIKNRAEVLILLKELPQASSVNDEEMLIFLEKNHLVGKGLGLVDIHLLASASLDGLLLVTEDKVLHKVARQLNLHYEYS